MKNQISTTENNHEVRAFHRVFTASTIKLPDNHFRMTFDDGVGNSARKHQRDGIPGGQQLCKIRIRNPWMVESQGQKTCPSDPQIMSFVFLESQL
ncbi:unnamed protein product [Linum trigynum]|uniref:Uncharacterized protein n=1 Tax=Linum trigynum TaxID=586398 RepID=A0AAV2DRC9_9ROSI